MRRQCPLQPQKFSPQRLGIFSIHATSSAMNWPLTAGAINLVRRPKVVQHLAYIGFRISGHSAFDSPPQRLDFVLQPLDAVEFWAVGR